MNNAEGGELRSLQQQSGLPERVTEDGPYTEVCRRYGSIHDPNTPMGRLPGPSRKNPHVTISDYTAQSA